MDYRSIIESRYNRQNWQELLHDIFRQRVQFWQQPQVEHVDKAMAKTALYTGRITLPDGHIIAIYEVELSNSVIIERNRAGIRNLLCSNWRGMGCSGAFMFCYRQNEAVLRFSYVSEAYNFADDGSLAKESTDTKRFTYLLGEGHRSRTAIKQFETLKNSSLNLHDITKAFSVEALSDLFFEGYKKQYEDIIEYITGKRFVKSSNKWVEKTTGNPCTKIMQEFSRFQNAEKAVRDYVKKLMGRLVFIQFLQKKGWMGCSAGDDWSDGDKEFVQNLFANTQYKNTFVDDVLEPLFHDINTKREGDLSSSPNVGVGIKIPYLNGGLFDKDDYDMTNFPLPEKFMKNLLDFFASYNFTIDENDPDDAEIGVDPEMLGRIFENLLEDNKDKGAFYTPKQIVQYMCRESLIAYLTTCVMNKQGANHRPEEEIKASVRTLLNKPEEIVSRMSSTHLEDFSSYIRNVKICDPAIGSGAFPMGLLNELVRCRISINAWAKDANGNLLEGNYAALKADIISNNIYGVDIERGAVDIARLRFWLSIVVDEQTPHSLPNFDYKFMQGNSLIPTFDGSFINLDTNKQQHVNVVDMLEDKKELYKLKKQFYKANGEEKLKLNIQIKKTILKLIARQLGYEYRSWYRNQHTVQLSIQFDEDSKENFEEVRKVLPFEKQQTIGLAESLNRRLKDESLALAERSQTDIHFFDWRIMFTEVFDNGGGFDIVIGNPPYIQLQNDEGKLAKLYENRDFSTFARTGDIYCLFYEQGYNLLRKGGHLCYITSNKWMRAGYGEKTRRFFSKETNPMLLIDFAGVKIFENATVDTNIILFSKAANAHKTVCAVTSKQNKDCINKLSDFVQQQHSVCRFDSSESWVILSPIEQSIKRKIEAAGIPLKDWDIQINYGIKTGCNEAFIISTEKRTEILANCKDDAERQRTDELIRPILRGRDIKRYGYDWANLYLIATFPACHYNIDDYPAVKDYLLSFAEDNLRDADYDWVADNYLADFCMQKLSQTGKFIEIAGQRIVIGTTSEKARKKTSNKWYETQDSISYWDDFSKPKIIYNDIAQQLTFALCQNGEFLNNTAYFFTSDKEHVLEFLLKALNTKVLDWYYRTLSVQLGEKAVRMFSIYVLKLPIPYGNLKALDSLDDDSMINRCLCSMCGMTEEEIDFIENQ